MRRLAIIAVVATCTYAATAPPAAASSPLKRACGVVGDFSGILGKACDVATSPGRVLKAGKKLLSGHPGGAVATLLGGGATAATAALGLTAIGAWVLTGASFALHETAKLVDKTTAPQLGTTWFSSTYWRMAGIAALLTLPFLFAAVVQALLRSDLALLARAALGYLPLAMLAVGIAAPLTMLLLAASDQMSAVVSSAAGNAGARYLTRAGVTLAGLSTIAAPFLAFLIGLLTAAGAVALWFELLMRDAAVYVIVLMLPLVFAALVWPSRRIWAVRAVELLIALIFAKFVIVSVLSLGGAALSATAAPSVAGWLAGLVILVMGAFAPWAMLRLLPLAELAGSAVQTLHSERHEAQQRLERAGALYQRGEEWATTTTAQMQRDRDAASEMLGATRPPKLPALGQATGPEDGAGGADPPAPETPPDAPPTTEERLPGLGGQWQAGNFSWRTLRLGPEGSWPNPSVWPAEDPGPPSPPTPTVDPGSAPVPPSGADAAPSPAGVWPPATRTDEAGPPPTVAPQAAAPTTAPTHDDSDPLPPAQEPGGGRL